MTPRLQSLVISLWRYSAKLAKNKAVYTAAKVACGWAGAVIIKGYIGNLAGAVMQKLPVNAKKANSDGQTDRPTYRHSES